MTAINEPVNFSATLKAGTTALANKPVTVYHTFNGVRADDVTKNTDANGVVTTTQTFQTGGLRSFFVEFKGDTTYMASTSNKMDITVQDAPVDEVGPVYTFVRGTDNELYYRKLENSAWGGWVSLGGILTAPPWQVTGSKGNVYVFVRGSDKAVWYRYVTPTGTWSAWQSLGGIVGI
jgi:hypothetical protein